MTEKIGNVLLVPQKSQEVLNQREQIAYREHRRKLITWLRDLGKDPQTGEGYSRTTVRIRSHRLDMFYRKVWEAEGYYTTNITTDHADAWMLELAHSDYSMSTKTDYQKAVKTYFKWRNWVDQTNIVWDPIVTFHDNTTSQQPRDYLTRNERR